MRDLDPVAATSEEVSRLAHDTFARAYAERPVGEVRVDRAMADEILAAWQAYAARMAQTASP